MKRKGKGVSAGCKWLLCILLDCQGGIDKGPSGESWESLGRESRRRDARRRENEGCWCLQKADVYTYTEGGSELSFTVATGMAAAEEDESQAHQTGMTPLAEMSPGKLFSQDIEGAGAICPPSLTCLTIDGRVVTFPNLLCICGLRGDYL